MCPGSARFSLRRDQKDKEGKKDIPVQKSVFENPLE